MERVKKEQQRGKEQWELENMYDFYYAVVSLLEYVCVERCQSVQPSETVTNSAVIGDEAGRTSVWNGRWEWE